MPFPSGEGGSRPALSPAGASRACAHRRSLTLQSFSDGAAPARRRVRGSLENLVKKQGFTVLQYRHAFYVCGRDQMIAEILEFGISHLESEIASLGRVRVIAELRRRAAPNRVGYGRVAQRGLAAASKPARSPCPLPRERVARGRRFLQPARVGPAPTEGRLRSRASATERLLPAGG